MTPLLPVRVVRLVLPYPPGVNEYWKPFAPPKGPARTIVSTIGREYRAAVREMLRARLGQLLEGPLRIDIDVFRPRRAGDVDRHSKVLFDVLQEDTEEGWPGVYRKDSQAYRLRAEHWDHEPGEPRVQVTVTEDANPRTPPESWPLPPEQRYALQRARERMEGTRAKERERVKQRKTPRLRPATGPEKEDRKVSQRLGDAGARLDLKCTTCGAAPGRCDCWTKCSCDWSYAKGGRCRNPDCSRPKKTLAQMAKSASYPRRGERR